LKALLSLFWFIAIVTFTLITIKIIQLIQVNDKDGIMDMLTVCCILLSAILVSASIFLYVENVEDSEIDRKFSEKTKNHILLGSILDMILLKTFMLKECFENTESSKEEICTNLSNSFTTQKELINKLHDKELFYSLNSENQKQLTQIIYNTNCLSNLNSDLEIDEIKDIYTTYEENAKTLLEKLDTKNSIYLEKIAAQKEALEEERKSEELASESEENVETEENPEENNKEVETEQNEESQTLEEETKNETDKIEVSDENKEDEIVESKESEEILEENDTKKEEKLETMKV
jgi:hypothetical protein